MTASLNMLNRHWLGQFFVVLLVVYLAFCTTQMVSPHIRTYVDEIAVVNVDNTVRIVDVNTQFSIKRGDIIKVAFHVERLWRGFTHIERFVANKKEEYLVEVVDLHFVPSRPNVQTNSIVVYPVPRFLKSGCGYEAYSRSYVHFSYNILSVLVDKEYQTKPIKFCIED